MPHFSRNLRFLGYLIAPIVAFLLGWILRDSLFSDHAAIPVTVIEQPADAVNTTKKPKVEKPEDIDTDLLWEVWNKLERNYVDAEKLDPQEQFYGALDGLTDSLDDPYTDFLRPEMATHLDDELNGEFTGIGAEIEVKDEQVTIVAPLKGSPAELAGVLPGDVILAVDGQEINEMGLLEIVGLIKGPKGEPVTIDFAREGEDEPVEIIIVRDDILVPSITMEYDEETELAYIELSTFSQDLPERFSAIARDLTLKNPKGIILDLRNNGGGLLDATIPVAREFLDEKVIVKTKGRQFLTNANLKSGSDGALLDVPVVVLINEGSASAAEMLAGALQDHGRAVLLGQTTFGKGTVQNIEPLSDGSYLKITIAEWMTPLGKKVSQIGLTPDLELPTDAPDTWKTRAEDLIVGDYDEWISKRKTANESYITDLAKSETPE